MSQSNLIKSDFEQILPDVAEYLKLSTTLEAFEELYENIASSMTISQEEVVQFESLQPGVLLNNYPAGGYSVDRSDKNIKVALESADIGKGVLIGAVVALLVKGLISLFKWIYNKITGRNKKVETDNGVKKVQEAKVQMHRVASFNEAMHELKHLLGDGRMLEDDKRHQLIDDLSKIADIQISYITPLDKAIEMAEKAIDDRGREGMTRAINNFSLPFDRNENGSEWFQLVKDYHDILPDQLKALDEHFAYYIKITEDIGTPRKAFTWPHQPIVDKYRKLLDDGGGNTDYASILEAHRRIRDQCQLTNVEEIPPLSKSARDYERLMVNMVNAMPSVLIDPALGAKIKESMHKAESHYEVASGTPRFPGKNQYDQDYIGRTPRLDPQYEDIVKMRRMLKAGIACTGAIVNMVDSVYDFLRLSSDQILKQVATHNRFRKRLLSAAASAVRGNPDLVKRIDELQKKLGNVEK